MSTTNPQAAAANPQPERPDKDRFFSRVINGARELDLSGQPFVRALFRNCHIRKLRGANLVNCTTENCEIDPADIRDIVGVTMTLNCHTLDGMKLSPLAMDALLFLVSRGAKDEVERERVRSIIDPHRRRTFEKIFPMLEYRRFLP